MFSPSLAAHADQGPRSGYRGSDLVQCSTAEAAALLGDAARSQRASLRENHASQPDFERPLVF
jgi:hypothetical protein